MKQESRIKDEKLRTKDKEQGSRIKDQGSRIKNQGSMIGIGNQDSKSQKLRIKENKKLSTKIMF